MPRSPLILSLGLHGALAVWMTGASAGPGWAPVRAANPGSVICFLGEDAMVSKPTSDFLPELEAELQAAPDPVPRLESLPEERSEEAVTPPRDASPVSVPLFSEPAPEGSTSVRSGEADGRNTDLRKSGRRGGRESEGAAGNTGRGSGGGYHPPQYLLRSSPTYPAQARARKLEGTVLLLLTIDASGSVSAVRLQRGSGHEILDQTAWEAVRTWKFTPARREGVEVSAEVEVPIRFRFEA